MTDGPEKYAPRFNRPVERENAPGQSAANTVQAQIRQFVGNAPSPLQRQSGEPTADEQSVKAQLNALFRHLTGDSFAEIDRLIRDLEKVREMLREEGVRVHREIAGYVSLNEAAKTAMKVISDSLKQWKEDPNRKPESNLNSD
jgi:hypothetical protein